MYGDRPVYFMVKPEAEEARRIDRFRHANGIPTDTPRHKLHATVQPLWDRRDMPRDMIGRTIAAMDGFRSDPFTIAFNGFNGSSLRCTATKAFLDLRDDVQRHLRAAGIPFPAYSSDPHITLVYGIASGAHRSIDPMTLLVGELLLIESIHGEGHVVHGRWLLESCQPRLFG